MEKHKICAVIFDMDGVIVDSEYVYMQYILAFVQKKNPSVTMEEIHPIIGLSSEASWGIVEKAVANGQSGMELLREFRGTLCSFSFVCWRDGLVSGEVYFLLLDDQSSVPSTHFKLLITICSFSSRRFNVHFCPL